MTWCGQVPREDLYEQGWREPMVRGAERHGGIES